METKPLSRQSHACFSLVLREPARLDVDICVCAGSWRCEGQGKRAPRQGLHSARYNIVPAQALPPSHGDTAPRHALPSSQDDHVPDGVVEAREEDPARQPWRKSPDHGGHDPRGWVEEPHGRGGHPNRPLIPKVCGSPSPLPRLGHRGRRKEPSLRGRWVALRCRQRAPSL